MRSSHLYGWKDCWNINISLSSINAEKRQLKKHSYCDRHRRNAYFVANVQIINEGRVIPNVVHIIFNLIPELISVGNYTLNLYITHLRRIVYNTYFILIFVSLIFWFIIIITHNKLSSASVRYFSFIDLECLIYVL